MKTVTLPSGEKVPALGQGTWMMGERRERRSSEIAALRAGVECGMTLIDTAEMYGDGAAETLIGEALGDVRDRLFLVSKAAESGGQGPPLGRQQSRHRRHGRACRGGWRCLRHRPDPLQPDAAWGRT